MKITHKIKIETNKKESLFRCTRVNFYVKNHTIVPSSLVTSIIVELIEFYSGRLGLFFNQLNHIEASPVDSKCENDNIITELSSIINFLLVVLKLPTVNRSSD